MLYLSVRMWQIACHPPCSFVLHACVRGASHPHSKKLTLGPFRSSETGIIECQIRLPCNPNHVFGSACIATWLKSHNTCPMCRHALFPKRQETTEDEASHLTRPVRLNRNGSASNEVDDGADDETWVTFHSTQSARAARISGLVLSYSTALRLNESVTQCSQIIGEQAGDAYSLADRSDESIAAACVYLASHFRGQPIALVEASRLAFHTDCTIQTIYRRLYAYHHAMPSTLWCEFFGTLSSLAPAEDRRSANVSTISALSCTSHTTFLRHKICWRSATKDA